MGSFATRVFTYIMQSPGWKTFFYIIIPIVAGVLSGTFVAEITGSRGIEWDSFYNTKSFYGLVVLTILSYFYFRAAYFFEKNIDKFLDSNYCRAYVRSQCLPEAAERYKKLMRDGNTAALATARKELERIIK